MPIAVMVVIDNSMYMQNQDYLPSRFMTQKECLNTYISTTLNDSVDSAVGIIPTCQYVPNIMITPTNERFNLNQFLHKLPLHEDFDISKSFKLAYLALNYRQLEEKSILVFLGTEIPTKLEDEMIKSFIDSICVALELGITVSVVFFADGIKYSEWVNEEIESNGFKSVVVKEKESFYDAVCSLTGCKSEEFEDDPELALAIKLSLEEANK
ncbi:subunit Rpn10 of 26S proteasome [Hamiltosporidium tvaerminnensis]|uniref:Subunit Rpn10 of 26S proteasome n=2 Tax=Hamiltosporidium TaxID=1176354 RepID=A0A4Q9LNG7_9MICR|nr:subunit Rpn10 of 26S proteasome [Hamiltosporidium magnivora]TBU09687.1 subunit Rpn10 of 26S proteasome [Hamiltosporidium magnivora]TBU11698.1 subunit Rpn10 of 26S proteasome [Hamiltosporidium tvaerminnensis]TBU11807.1 subunit Rpn10 of 26S proteasome [Hamiltosporidium tvaerminnensis]